MSEEKPLTGDTETPYAEPKVYPWEIWKPKSFAFRLSMLALICLLTFGSYFCYDNPAALQKPLTDEVCDGNSFKYEVLYSVYSWPNTVLAIFGGFLIDRWLGIRLGALLFASLILIGQVVFAVGVSSALYPVTVLGRLFFGFGGECLSVAQSNYCVKWFQGRELNFAFGVALSFSRVGSAINFNTVPYIAKYTDLSLAIWVGAIICLVSAGAAIAAALLDLWGERQLREARKRGGLAEPTPDPPIRFVDVLHFPFSLWLIYAICVTFYVGVFVFIQVASGFLQTKYGWAPSFAGHIISVPYFFSAAVSPFLGLIIDNIGFQLVWVLFACALMTGVHWIFIASAAAYAPYIAFGLMGIAYTTLAAALWPSVAIIVPLSRLGTAYGIMNALQNAGLAIFPLAIGATVHAVPGPQGYEFAEMIFIGCLTTATLLAAVLILIDLREGRKLNCSAKTMRARQKAEQDRKDAAAGVVNE